jgi:hypothetical protein
MSADGESLADKQRRLAADIARQRGQLALAYRDLAKPILYTEYGLRGFGFLRQNPWLLTIVPAGLSAASSLIALRRALKTPKTAPRKFKWFGRDAERDTDRAVKRETKGIAGHVLKWGGHGWKLFRLYNKARKFFL